MIFRPPTKISALAIGFFVALNATADAFFYCGSALVRPGLSQYQVASVCGQPAWINSRTAYVSSPAFVAGLGRGHGQFFPYQQVLAPIVFEEWIYNFGPNALTQSLTFRDGALIGVRALGYGN